MLIPEPEDASGIPAYDIPPGYYNSDQMLDLISCHRTNAAAIQYIADMLETGEPATDGLAVMLRTNRRNPFAIDRIIQMCKADEPEK